MSELTGNISPKGAITGTLGVVYGKDGQSVTHEWEGTTLKVTSASGTSSADLKGEKGDTGRAFAYDDFTEDQLAALKGDQGEKGERGVPGVYVGETEPTDLNVTVWVNPDGSDYETTTIKDTADRMCPAFTESGAVVACEPVEGYPLEVVSNIQAVQSGSGDPLPNNIRPIIGHSEVKLTQSGKNLLAYPYVDTTKTVDGMTFTDNGDGSITLNGTSTSPYLSYTLHLETFADALKDGVTYHLSPGTDDTNILLLIYYNNENGEDRWASSNITWKKEYTLVQIYLQVAEVATYTNMVLYPQIEIGTTTTAYEPYRGYTYTMDLGQEVYGGSLNWNTGVLTIDWFYEELDGVEKPFIRRATYGSSGDNYCATMTYQPSSRIQGNILCSHLKNICDVGAGYCYAYGYDSHDIIFNLNGWSALKDANDWLAAQKQKGTPFQVCYELAEPITIQLTPQEITALSGINTLYSDTGITEVTGRANPVAIINNLQDRLAALEMAVVNNA